MENNSDKNQRILSYSMSHKLSDEELQAVSAAGMSYGPCASVSGGRGSGVSDMGADWKLDF